MKIYVASSWRNSFQPEVVKALRLEGHEVYDFKKPSADNHGFHWSDIDPEWESWTPEKYKDCLSHPLAEDGYSRDLEAMEWADIFVGVLPFGRSASMEMGWAAGNKKTTMLLLENGEPELMVKMFDYIFCSLPEVVAKVNQIHGEFTD